MRTDHALLETTVRAHLASLLDGVLPGDIDPGADMAHGYGLTSLNKVLFLTTACQATGVDVSCFTEHDLARMRTLHDVCQALAPHAAAEA